MFNICAYDVFHHWSVTHAFAVRQASNQTLKEMKQLPPHLMDDVNARGLLPDVSEWPRPVQSKCR